MALLSFVDSTPRAYRLKASNAAPLFQHSPGQSDEQLIAAAYFDFGGLRLQRQRE
jgi:hypothetical protein